MPFKFNHPQRILAAGLLCAGILQSCSKGKSISDGGKELFDATADVPLIGVTIGSNTNTTYGSYLSLIKGDVYTTSISKPNAVAVDLILQNSGTSGANFMTPACPTLNAFTGAWANVSTWDSLNNGTMIRLRGAALEHSLAFDSIRTSQQLLKAFEDATTLATALPDYNAANDGPGDRLRYLQKGDLVYYKSSSKKLTAVIRLSSLSTGNAGSIALEIKSVSTVAP